MGGRTGGKAGEGGKRKGRDLLLGEGKEGREERGGKG